MWIGRELQAAQAAEVGLTRQVLRQEYEATPEGRGYYSASTTRRLKITGFENYGLALGKIASRIFRAG